MYNKPWLLALKAKKVFSNTTRQNHCDSKLELLDATITQHIIQQTFRVRRHLLRYVFEVVHLKLAIS